MFTFADQVDAMNEALSTERAEGEKKGESKLAALMDKLFSLGRVDDARKAVKDESFVPVCSRNLRFFDGLVPALVKKRVMNCLKQFITRFFNPDY